ncbi:uncharacterized protein LOC135588668 [Musa acuminata AAA Group]|uniref:uncharacterized protein LOC135588668 n=1 Tax=Musa acuminata AAA Group TaxID=214697 RepID=UPI0031D84AB3
MWAVGGLNSGPAHMTPNQPPNIKEGSFDRSQPECSSGMAGDDQAEDARREAALACTPLFQPNFKPSKATQAQLDKLKELHKKRLQLKEKEEVKRLKGSSQRRGKICEEDTDVKNSTNSSASSADGSSSVSPLEQRSCLDQRAPTLVSNKRRKLHWGLDAKERWERKANM